MSVSVQHLWKGRRVRVAGTLDVVAVASRADLAAVYDAYHELVYRRCYATLGDHEAALDATQDVFLHALSGFDEIRHDIVRGLLDLARTLSYDRKHRPSREVMLADPRQPRDRADDPADIAERHDVLGAIWAGLTAVERRYLADKFAGFTFEEIARRNRRALGTVSSNLARARSHARRMREPMLPAGIALAGWRRLTDLTRRARHAAHSSSAALVAQPVQGLTLSLALAGVLAGAAPAAPLALRPSAAASAAAFGPAGLDRLAGPAALGAGPNATGPGLRSMPDAGGGNGSARSGPSSRLPLAVGTSATSETPEDTSIVAVTPSPDYDNDHTIFALGRGHGCRCEVLFRSADGGATWHPHAGPPDGDEIVLPPAYPADARIFIGFTSNFGPTGNYWTPALDKPFQPIVGAPAGVLALPAGFDAGDARLLIATTNGLMSYDTTNRLVSTLIANSFGDPVPAVATATGMPRIGAIVVTASQAFAPGAAGESLAATQGSTVWTCPPKAMCSRISSINGLFIAGLAVSPGFANDATLAVFDANNYLVSHNGARSFTSFPAPASVAIDALTMVPAMWMSGQTGANGFQLFHSTTPGSTWVRADAGNSVITTEGGRTIAITSGRILFLLSQGGMLCTVNNGVSWAARCPAT